MIQTQPNDDRVLELRSQGQSYGAIAKTLGLDHPSDAHDAFHRALCRRPTGEQRVLCDQELARLAHCPDASKLSRTSPATGLPHNCSSSPVSATGSSPRSTPL